MKKIKCPFEDFLNEFIDLYIVFDNMSIPKECLTKVIRVLKYICIYKETKASKIILKIIKANVSDYGMTILKKYYLSQFDPSTRTFKRLLYVKEEEDIREIMQVFSSIEAIYDVLAICPIQFQ